MVMRRKRERLHRAATVTQARASVNGRCAQFQRDIQRMRLVDLPQARARALTLLITPVIISVQFKRREVRALIQRGGGTGPMKPRQPGVSMAVTWSGSLGLLDYLTEGLATKVPNPADVSGR
jgi:hypothetical protein